MNSDIRAAVRKAQREKLEAIFPPTECAQPDRYTYRLFVTGLVLLTSTNVLLLIVTIAISH